MHDAKEDEYVIDTNSKDWWQSAVIYQIYPKSFQDTNGDGIGDLPGIIEHLDYLKDLGVTGLWLTPIYVSPQKDNGYDIADYRQIDPRIGTMEQFEELVAEARKRGMVILMDLVLNHTSDQHEWFRQAKASRENPYHDYYVWRDGTPDAPPNEMKAIFGGSAWTYVPEIGQYYFNAFSPYQPDLNWDNPKVRQELYDMIRFWVEKGVGGFRLDVIDMVAKEPDIMVTNNGTHLHEYIQELRREAFKEDYLITVGETGGATTEIAKKFSNPDGSELGMVFQFEHMYLDGGEDKWDLKKLDLRDLKRVMANWQTELFEKGWNSLYLDNHDQPRIVSRWGNDGEYRRESAKMLATMLHGMQGTPYVYQGEELGMTNVQLDIEQYDDLEIKNFYEERTAQGEDKESIMESIYAKGRDNARTPMQWTDGPNAGFSTATPWLAINPNYKEVNAEKELADSDSVYPYYQKLIGLRDKYPLLRTGSFTLLEPDNERTFCYTRDSEKDGHMLVECNFTEEEQPEVVPDAFKGAEVLLANYDKPEGVLRPYEARILYVPAAEA